MDFLGTLDFVGCLVIRDLVQLVQELQDSLVTAGSADSAGCLDTLVFVDYQVIQGLAV